MDTLFLDYEDSLIGRKKEISSYNFYGSDEGGENQRRALSVIRYAIENVLCWTPDECIKKFDSYVVRVMKLEKVFNYIRWPDEIDAGNTKYVLSLLYPDRVHMNQQKLIEDVLVGVINNERQFPREYFVGPTGFYRYCACIQYLMTHYKQFSSIEEMYEFLLSAEGKRFLYRYRLKVPQDQLRIDMCKVIHMITRDLEYSELMYSFYSFQQQYDKVKRNEIDE